MSTAMGLLVLILATVGGVRVYDGVRGWFRSGMNEARARLEGNAPGRRHARRTRACRCRVSRDLDDDAGLTRMWRP